MTTQADIINAIAAAAPLSLQLSWDNSGVQVGDTSRPCSGVMLCVDPTPTVIDEAAERGCNLVVSHHPLLFKGLKHITGATPVEQAVIKAITKGISIYSAHTPLDSTVGGISYTMARMLGARVTEVLDPFDADPATGIGVVARFDRPLSADEFVSRVKEAFGSPVCRCSEAPDSPIECVAMCGGAGGEYLPRAVKAGAQAFLSSDIRYHDFVDHGGEIFIVDIGHFESESCAKDIFYHVITEKFPNFAVCKSELEKNSINYK